jgi:ribose transport system permease protein
MSQLVTDLKYRVPPRYLASWVALATLLVAVVIAVPVTLHPHGLKIATVLAGVLALASFGQMLVVMLGAIDLSVSAIVTVGAGMVVHYGTPGSSTPLVILAALAVTVSITIVNWLLISVLRLNSIIVTLGVLGVIAGGITIWTGASFSVSGLAPQPIQDFSTRSWFNISSCFLVAIAGGIVLALVLSKTKGGRQVAAIGANRRAARLQGMKVARVEFAAFVGAGLFYGLAGILVAGFLGQPGVAVGDPYQLLTITAVAIAGAAFNGGLGSVAGILGACLFLQLLDEAMALHGFSGGVRVAAQGVALVLAVSAITLLEFAVSASRRATGGGHRVSGEDREIGGESLTPAAHMKETT